ncbi:hypothetical protein SRABI03_02886 [Microbacterium foliorum]|nr:hypothetical protein SRABI03_02886 [Microbacterium foliorum]
MGESSVSIGALMRLVAVDAPAASDHLTKVYDWKYSEATAIAKALVAGGFALFLPLLLPVVQPDSESPLSPLGLWLVIASAVILVLLGGGLFVRARRFHREYLAAQTLLGQLREIQPFLHLYQDRAA